MLGIMPVVLCSYRPFVFPIFIFPSPAARLRFRQPSLSHPMLSIDPARAAAWTAKLVGKGEVLRGDESLSEIVALLQKHAPQANEQANKQKISNNQRLYGLLIQGRLYGKKSGVVIDKVAEVPQPLLDEHINMEMTVPYFQAWLQDAMKYARVTELQLQHLSDMGRSYEAAEIAIMSAAEAEAILSSHSTSVA